MDKPAKLAYTDNARFQFFQAGILIPVVTIATGFIIVLITGAPPAELVLPGAVMGGISLILIGIFALVALGYRLKEKYLINRMFAGDIWECWQFSALEWDSMVEAVCKLISPKDEGKDAYSGLIASSIFGFVIAVILYVITIFAFDEPGIKTGMRFVAGGILIFMIGVGFFQPIAARIKAERYHRKAMVVAEPRVWFGPDGVYHETLGHTSLKGLFKVMDQTESRKRIQFSCKIDTDESDDLMKFHVPVPSSCEKRAGNLVGRYRTELLLT